LLLLLKVGLEGALISFLTVCLMETRHSLFASTGDPLSFDVSSTDWTSWISELFDTVSTNAVLALQEFFFLHIVFQTDTALLEDDFLFSGFVFREFWLCYWFWLGYWFLDLGYFGFLLLGWRLDKNCLFDMLETHSGRVAGHSLALGASLVFGGTSYRFLNHRFHDDAVFFLFLNFMVSIKFIVIFTPLELIFISIAVLPLLR
jgi:hypothetical protein